MVWFVIWSIACGFAQNEISIDFFRAMQGAALGAAIVRFPVLRRSLSDESQNARLSSSHTLEMQPSALGILGTSFPPGQRKTTAFAIFSAGAPLGGSLGAVFGGV